MKNFTEEEKLKIWLDYVVTTVALNNVPIEINYREEHDANPRLKCYPNLGVSTFIVDKKFTVKRFETFCSETNELASENIHGWYWRFKDRIFK